MLKRYLELRWYKRTNLSHLPLAEGSERFELATFCCELSSKPQRQLDSSHLSFQPPPNSIQREKWLILFSCCTELVPSIKKAWGTGKMNNLGQFSSASPLHNLAKKIKKQNKTKETGRASTDKKESSPNKVHTLYRKETEADQWRFVKIPKVEWDLLEEVVLPFGGKRIMSYTLFHFFPCPGRAERPSTEEGQAAKTFLGIEVIFLAPSLSSALGMAWLTQESSPLLIPAMT